METVVFHLSIWRDYTPPHPVALHGYEADFQVVTSKHSLQAEVYSWPLQQDHFAGIAEEQTRNRLRALLEKLDVSRPPVERPLAALNDFVTAAEKAIEENKAISVQWNSGDMTVMINPLLALVLHLKWLVRCFKDRPGISVSIR